MDFAEEQRNEIEALQCIYFDEFTQNPENPNEFHILLRADTVEDEEEPTSLELHVKFTPKYPEEVPQLQLREPSGLSETNVEELLEELQQMTADSLGMAMIFTLTGHLKERMDQITQDKAQAKLLLLEEARRIEDEKDNLRYQGTAVTVETFLAWKAKFDSELDAVNAEKKKREDEKRKKPTGRQLFESDKSLVASDANYLGEGEVDVDISLFEQDMEGLDLVDSDEENDALMEMIRGSD